MSSKTSASKVNKNKNSSYRKSSSLVQCHKCKKQVEQKATVSCSACKHKFEFDCIGLSEKLYRLMGADSKKNWRCKLCTANPKSKKHTDVNSNVTIRKKPLSPQTSSAKSNSEYQEMNTTDVSSQNSLVLDSHSCDSHIYDDDSSVLEVSVLNRSCPETAFYLREELLELKTKISDLEIKLKIAENEIDHLVTEKGSLKKQIKTYEKKTERLSQICRSTTKERSRKERKSPNNSNLDLTRSQQCLDEDQDIHLFRETPSLELLNEKQKLPIVETPIKNDCEIQHNENFSTYVPLEKESVTKHKIIVLGDEQALGLSTKLLKCRTNGWNDQYKPFALIKPNASSSETLNDCINIKQKLTAFDYVIICTGSHDTNPKEVIANICIALHELRNTNVIILPINYSQYLNETMLNKDVKLFASGFSNCIVANLDQVNISHSRFLDLMCVKINVLIDFPRYEHCFIKQIRRRVTTSHDHNKSKNVALGLSNDGPIKGTIPYYFKVIPKTQTHTIDPSPQTNNTSSNICLFRDQ